MERATKGGKILRVVERQRRSGGLHRGRLGNGITESANANDAGRNSRAGVQSQKHPGGHET